MISQKNGFIKGDIFHFEILVIFTFFAVRYIITCMCILVL